MARLVITIGFALAVGFGILGGFLPAGDGQDAAWFVSSIGLIVGCGLLAVRHAAEGRDLTSVGFALLAIGEMVMSSGQGGLGPHRLATFARGVGLYVPGLLLLAWSDRYPWPSRLLAFATAAPFAAHATLHFMGGAPTEAGPLASTGYALLSLTLAAITWALYRPVSAATAATSGEPGGTGRSTARRI